MSNKEKEVEFYAATVGAWLNTKFELDKSLLTLSTGAIGLLVTLLTTVGASSVEGWYCILWRYYLFLFVLSQFFLFLNAMLSILRGSLLKHKQMILY
ncbi:hypothetical protein AT251_22010 [Enterovibrio nigricans]|nr:hypothetical protein AT251_22010 [Enterovibrio nigricans]